ncbi:MAG: hypothetical protein D6685_15080, partial [Bacteroidetes bacterium]
EATRPAPATGGPKTKEQKRREAEARNRRYRALQNGEAVGLEAFTPHQLRKALKEVEAKVLAHEERQAELEAALADPDVYQDGDRARRLTLDYEAVQAELETLYARWETLAEHVAALDG